MLVQVHKRFGRSVWSKAFEAPSLPPPGTWICDLTDEDARDYIEITHLVLVADHAPYYVAIAVPADDDLDPAVAIRAFEAQGWTRLDPALVVIAPAAHVNGRNREENGT